MGQRANDGRAAENSRAHTGRVRSACAMHILLAMNAGAAPAHRPFTATMVGAVGRRQIAENLRVVAQAIAVFALVGAAIWSLL